MNTRALHRFLAAMLLMIATLATPGEALAHGYTHHDHAQTHAAQAAQESHGQVASERDEDHPHPDAGCAARWGWRAMAFVVSVTTNVPVTPVIATPANLSAVSPARQPGDPWSGPPARVRAPPIG